MGEGTADSGWPGLPLPLEIPEMGGMKAMRLVCGSVYLPPAPFLSEPTCSHHLQVTRASVAAVVCMKNVGIIQA